LVKKHIAQFNQTCAIFEFMNWVSVDVTLLL